MFASPLRSFLFHLIEGVLKRGKPFLRGFDGLTGVAGTDLGTLGGRLGFTEPVAGRGERLCRILDLSNDRRNFVPELFG